THDAQSYEQWLASYHDTAGAETLQRVGVSAMILGGGVVIAGVLRYVWPRQHVDTLGARGGATAPLSTQVLAGKRERETSSPTTRIVARSSAPEVLAVRCARLSVIRGPDSGRALELGERSSATIGTHPDADLLLTDDSVSKLHAEIRSEPEGFVLRD